MQLCHFPRINLRSTENRMESGKLLRFDFLQQETWSSKSKNQRVKWSVGLSWCLQMPSAAPKLAGCFLKVGSLWTGPFPCNSESLERFCFVCLCGLRTNIFVGASRCSWEICQEKSLCLSQSRFCWPWVLAGPKRSLLFVQVSVWQIKSRLSPSHCVAHCADFHRHGNRSQFSSAGDGVTEQPLRYMWEKNQKTFLCRDCTGCCQVENDTIEADASLCPQRIQQKGPPFRNQTVALSWNVVLGCSRYLLLQTMKYCNSIKTTNTNWKRLRMQFQTLQHERDWAVTDEWYWTDLRRSKPNATSTSATNRKKNDDWVRKLSNLQSVHWVHDEGNEKLGIVCVSPGRIRSWEAVPRNPTEIWRPPHICHWQDTAFWMPSQV